MTSINFKGYKIDLSFWEIAVPRLMGNTEGFAQLFSIKYRIKHNLKMRKHHRSVMLKVLHCGMLRTWKCFSLPISFSVVSPFPLRTSLDWDILAFIAAFKLLLLGSFSLQCKAYLPFLFTGGQGTERKGRREEQGEQEIVHSVYQEYLKSFSILINVLVFFFLFLFLNYLCCNNWNNWC